MKTICFWGDIYSALNGAHSGGAEKQIAIMARMFSELSWHVIVVDTEAEEDHFCHNISVISIKKHIQSKKIKRSIVPYSYYIYKLFLEINPDIFYLRIRGFQHIIPFLVAKKIKSKIIFGVSSDLDLDSLSARWHYFYKYNSPKYLLTRGILTEILFPVIIRKSDLILVQNLVQKRLCAKKSIEAIIFHNIIIKENLPSERQLKNYFIIIGSFDKRKGFDISFKLIKELRDIKFMLVGSPRDKSSYIKINELQNAYNVKIMGRLSPHKVIDYLSHAKALINTSPKEGFPNVFLESWSVSTPVISLFVNPDNVLNSQKLGIYCHGSYTHLKNAIINFNPQEYQSNSFSTYLDENHSSNYGLSRLRKAEELLSS